MNEGQEFAARWIAAWNSMELDRALGLWAEDVFRAMAARMSAFNAFSSIVSP